MKAKHHSSVLDMVGDIVGKRTKLYRELKKSLDSKAHLDQMDRFIRKFRCHKCRARLKEAGAIVLSPPAKDGRTVTKLHICVSCWDLLWDWLDQPVSHR